MSAAGWFYVQDDKRLGPVGVDHIVHLVVTTVLSPSALVWRQGLAEWTEARHVPEIAAHLPPPIPPGQKPGAPEPPPLPAKAGAAKAAEPTPPPPHANPKIEELRHKLEKEPTPRAYGALAEELRKAGEFAEAIRVSREGVEKSPAYPTLRVTLGRALMEHGELEAARQELQTVLQAVPDNILAERYLGETLEGLGDRAGARRQYLKALALAPGDAQLVARLRSLSGSSGPTGVAANGPVPGTDDVPIDIPPPPAAPPAMMDADPLAGMLDEGGAESLVADVPPPPPPVIMDDPRPPSGDLPPIPLVAVEETFEIERANDIAAGTTPKRKSPPEKAAKTGPPKPAPTPVLIDLPADEPPLFDSDPPVIPLAKPAPEAPPPPPPAPPPAPPPVPAKGKAAKPGGSTLIIPPPAPPPIATAVSEPDVVVTPGGPPVPDTPIAWPTGRIADHEFADLVREVYSRKWSGLLTLNHTGVEKSVRVQDGRLVFAFSSSRDDRLGELLLRRGRITLHQYVEASRAMGKGIRLGTLLVELGALDARELVKAVMDHTQEIIYSAFEWTEGLYHFTEGGSPPEPITLKLSTPDAILEGIRRIDQWSRIEHAVGTLETRYVRARGYEKVLSEMTLSLEKLSILTGLDVEQDVGTICRNSTLSHFEVCRTLWAYRVIGVVQRLA